VIDPASGKGVAGAVVTLNGGPARAAALAQAGLAPAMPAPPPPPPQILTDNDGRFAFMNLTRGNYTLSATKSGYTAGAYGRVRPGGPTRTLQLDDGEKLPDATVRLFKLGSISGTVSDDAGEPVVSTMIRVYRRSLMAGRRVLTPSGGQVATDDRGMYRIGNLPPGEYVVVAPVVPVTVPAGSQGPGNRPNLQSTAFNLSFGQPLPGAGGQAIGPDARFLLQRANGLSGDVAAAPDASGRVVGFQTVYYPNAPTASGAQNISIASGEERNGIDIALRRVPTVAISGLITGSPDGAAADYAVRLIATDTGDIIQEPESAVAMSDASGVFMFLGVPSGQYVVHVVRMPRRQPPMEIMTRTAGGEALSLAQFQAMQAAQAVTDPLLWATLPVSVSDRDVQGLALTLREGLTVSGKLEFSGSRPRPAPQQMSQAQITIEPADGRMPEYDQGPPSRVQPDGRFTTTGRLPGRYFVRPGGFPGGWALQSITANGIDVTDSPIDLSTSSVSNVVVTFSDLNQDLRGTVTGIPQGAEPPGVAVFPADSTAWKNFGINPTRMRMTRASGPGGQFGTGTMPPGDYFVVAIPDEYTSEWQDPAYLELLSRAATRFSLTPGERKMLDVAVQDIKPPSMGRSPGPNPASVEPDDAPRPHGPFVEEPRSDEPAPQQVRDARTAQPAGAGSISGVVRLDDGSNAPARFARISVRSSTTPGERVALTDNEGRYTVVGLPVGTYQVQVTKPAYLSMYYGARRPVVAQGSPVRVEPGQAVTGIDVKLQRGSVVTGIVIGTDGEPAPGARIQLFQRTMADGEPRLSGAPTTGQVMTDDHGMFRLFGIRPGSYAIAATPPNTVLGSAELRQLSDQEMRTAMAAVAGAKAPPAGTGRILAPAAGPPPAVTPVGRPVGFSPVFYPGTLVEDEAGIFTLTPGQEMRISIGLQLVPTARIEGTVVTADGQPAPVNGVQVMLQRTSGNSTMSTSMRMTEPGRFQAVGVPPGRYQLIARWTEQVPSRGAGATGPGQVSTSQWYAQEQIDVSGVDLFGINLAFAPPITVSGKVVFDGAPPGGDAQIQVRLDSAGRTPTGSFARSIKPTDGGEFSITNVTPGRYRLNAFVTVPNPGAVVPGAGPPPWQVRSAAIDGRDAFETPFEVVAGRTPSPAVVTLTTRLPQLSATITDKAGKSVPNMVFVLFSASKEHWTGNTSRRVRSILRPNDEGVYQFTSMLPGEYFLVVLNDLEPSDLNDPSFLELLIPAAIRITLAEGDKKVQNLRIAGGS
jgi:protocatechuate 3,4-dioxygenase beta subunit